MESKKFSWWWLVVGFLILLVVGGGVWLGLNGGFNLGKGSIDERLLFEDDMAESGEVFAVVRGWDSKNLWLDFETRDGIGGFKIDFLTTNVFLSVQEYDYDSDEVSVSQVHVLSMNEPYFETAFCIDDLVVFKVSEGFLLSDKELTKIDSGDVDKITNLGPSVCRQED